MSLERKLVMFLKWNLESKLVNNVLEVRILRKRVIFLKLKVGVRKKLVIFKKVSFFEFSLVKRTPLFIELVYGQDSSVQLNGFELYLASDKWVFILLCDFFLLKIVNIYFLLIKMKSNYFYNNFSFPIHITILYAHINKKLNEKKVNISIKYMKMVSFKCNMKTSHLDVFFMFSQDNFVFSLIIDVSWIIIIF